MYDFSIITVNLNNLDGLRNTIKAVSSQTYKNFEHIIIDGNSVDGSAKFIETISTNFVVSSDQGIFDAMNKGINKSLGRLLCFLNSGDIIYPDALEHVHKLFNHEVYDFVMNPVDIYSRENKFLFTKFPNQVNKDCKYLTQMPAAHMAFFIKRSIFHSIGNFDLSYQVSSDFDFTNRLFQHTNKYLLLNKSIGRFYLGGKSSSYKPYYEDFLILKKNNFPIFSNSTIFIKKNIIYFFKQLLPEIFLSFIKKLRSNG